MSAQAASAAQSLKGEAADLAQAVSVFKLGRDTGAPAYQALAQIKSAARPEHPARLGGVPAKPYPLGVRW